MHKILIFLIGILFMAGCSAPKDITDEELGGRTGGEWTQKGTHIEPTNSLGSNILIKGTNKYLNFNSTSGSLGYGFRDNAGAMEYKSSGGLWAEVGSGGGGGGTTTVANLILNEGYTIVGDGSDQGSATTSLFIDLVGNVGISTTTPAYKLDVYGDMRIDGIGTSTAFNVTGKKLTVDGDRIYHGVGFITSGMAEDKHDISLRTSGGNIYFDVEKIGGGDVEYIFDEIEYELDCTGGGGTGGKATVMLSEGTATDPVRNYIYVEPSGSSAVLMASTTLPSDDFTWVGLAVVQSDTEVAATGPLLFQRTNEALKSGGRGALSYQREKLRFLGPEYIQGIDQTLTISVNGGAADDIVLTTNAGKVFQLHRQTWASYNSSSDGLFVANASGAGSLTKYQKITNLNQLLETSDGTAIGHNDRFNLTIWCAMNSASQQKCFVNLPTDVYSNNSRALADRDNYSVTTLPLEFKTTGYLLAKLVFRYQTNDSGTWTNLSGGTAVQDLRGIAPGFNTGGAGGSDSETFIDTLFRVFDDGDATKEIAFQASGISTGNTRTLTVQDSSGTLAYTSDLHDSVTLAGTPNYLTLSGQQITQTVLDTSDDTNLAVSGTLLNLTGDTLSVNEGTLTDTKFCTYESGTGIQCTSDAGASLPWDVIGSNTSVGIGDSALNGTFTGAGNVAVGYNTLTALTSGIENVAIGYNASPVLTTGSDNIAIGYEALLENVSGSDNVCIGEDACKDGEHTRDVAIGFQSLENSSGGQNVSMGWWSQRSIGAGAADNVGIGFFSNSNNRGDKNTAVGSYAMSGLSGSDTYNGVGIGYGAGQNLHDGYGNILVGYQAGNLIDDGNLNIIIGYDIDPPADNTSNHLNIGGTIYGNLSTDSVGIGQVTPAYNLDVAGTFRSTGAATIGAYTLPATDGTNGQVLQTNGSGAITWQDAGGGSSYTAAGTLLDLTGTEFSINEGTLTDDKLCNYESTGTLLECTIDDNTANWNTAYGWGDWNGNVDISTDTNLVGGTNITLSGDTLNVDDAFIKNNASDTMGGTLTADGLTLGANENVTLGAQTLDHDGTDFNFNDSVDINDGTHGLRIVPGTSTTTLEFY